MTNEQLGQAWRDLKLLCCSCCFPFDAPPGGLGSDELAELGKRVWAFSATVTDPVEVRSGAPAHRSF